MAHNIQWRRDSAADWTSNNPTLAEGEPGYETDTGKFKIGDGATAWASLAYISLGNPQAWTVINKSADESVTSSTALQDDDDFSFSVSANKRYHIRMNINFLSNTTPALKFDFDGPASPNKFYFMGRASTDAGVDDTLGGSGLNTTYATVLTATNEQTHLVIYAYLDNGANAGTLKFRWAQNSSSGTATTIYKDSTLEWLEVP